MINKFRVMVVNPDLPIVTSIFREEILSDEAKNKCNATVVLDEEMNKITNKINNLSELLQITNNQIFECCKILGIDTDKYPGDGWTLHERCQEIMKQLKSYENK